MIVRDPDRMERRFHLAAPVIEEIAKHRKLRGNVIVLADEELQQRRMVRHVIADLDRAEAVTLELSPEIGVGRAQVQATIHVTGPLASSTKSHLDMTVTVTQSWLTGGKCAPIRRHYAKS